ncbi:MAG: hypothetical protein A3H96_06555 [Acidobacteria bacterium RIFCSPLOWO2_02_FULL_67_36]|nr:MAG: hypothetical protein A3H96_06555 [Acidobacteria bacterium RIFCSPLOWO2_02_FULL_67_36]OFW23604.1 MAG: hypothetical protein A3G21_06670 [Acidobacteria bacterium RIFCSPLOWO2_12_FULL_66_21]
MANKEGARSPAQQGDRSGTESSSDLSRDDRIRSGEDERGAADDECEDVDDTVDNEEEEEEEDASF